MSEWSKPSEKMPLSREKVNLIFRTPDKAKWGAVLGFWMGEDAGTWSFYGYHSFGNAKKDDVEYWSAIPRFPEESSAAKEEPQHSAIAEWKQYCEASA